MLPCFRVDVNSLEDDHAVAMSRGYRSAFGASSNMTQFPSMVVIAKDYVIRGSKT